MRLIVRLIAPFLALLVAWPAMAAFETRAGAAWVYDLTNDAVLLSKNAQVPLPPASMSKLMTLNMLFEALRESPTVTLETQFNVSQRAQDMGGSTMMLQRGDRPTVEDLIKGVIVQSGNDATVAIAEGLAGTEAAFARLMNERARAIGLKNSNFTNASGWPDPEHRMSAEDLGVLSARLIREFPEYYVYFSQSEYYYAERSPANRFNRNPLLSLGIGADGLKTGHTDEAGFGLAGSAVQGGRRIVFIITGLDSADARAEEAERLVNWAMRQFVERKAIRAGQRFAEIPVHMGSADSVPIVAAEDLTLLLPLSAANSLDAEIIYSGPVSAPITAGTELARMVISVPDLPDVTVPLVAENDVAEGGILVRLRIAANQLLQRMFGANAATP